MEGNRLAYSYPVYGLVSRSISQRKKSERVSYVVTGGGGGKSKTGVPNRICVYRYSPFVPGVGVRFDPLEELNDVGDVVMNVAIHSHCNLLAYATLSNEVFFHVSVPIVNSDLEISPPPSIPISSSPDDRVKLFHFSDFGKFFCGVSALGYLHIVGLPGFQTIIAKQLVDTKGEEIIPLDLSWGEGDRTLAIASASAIYVYGVDIANLEGRLHLNRKILAPPKASFKFAQYSEDGEHLLAVAIAEKGYSSLHKYEILQYRHITSARIARKTDNRITAFALSRSAQHIAIGTSEGLLEIYESSNLTRLMAVEKAHSWFISKISFPVDEGNVLTAGGDNQVCWHRVQDRRNLWEFLNTLRGALYFLIVTFISYLIIMSLLDNAPVSYHNF